MAHWKKVSVFALARFLTSDLDVMFIGVGQARVLSLTHCALMSQEKERRDET